MNQSHAEMQERITRLVHAHGADWANAWGVRDGIPFREILILTLLICLTRHTLEPHRWRISGIQNQWKGIAKGYRMQAKLQRHWQEYGDFPPSIPSSGLVPPSVLLVKMAPFTADEFDRMAETAAGLAKQCEGMDPRGRCTNEKAAFNALVFGDKRLAGQPFGLKQIIGAETPKHLHDVVGAVLPAINKFAIELTGSEINCPAETNRYDYLKDNFSTY